MSYYPCKHKALNDHSRMEGDTRIWTCSYCAKQAPWRDGWSYFGNIECKDCWAAQIDEVKCDDCELTAPTSAKE